LKYEERSVTESYILQNTTTFLRIEAKRIDSGSSNGRKQESVHLKLGLHDVCSLLCY